ncbi:hypothetical protein [Rhodococcus sp. MEB041]|uniref:hypothetical protein n=1 Tax=Rhodococcus sp. MEB041 TaxID=3040323 RepID=UPI00254CE838|nr:hypothetical protein [Rhodococcus sp. MEB041]
MVPDTAGHADFRYDELDKQSFAVTIDIDITEPNISRGRGETLFSSFDQHFPVGKFPRPSGPPVSRYQT